MTIEGIDLLDPERFARCEYHDMFTRLRREDPVYWHTDQFGGFWNVTKHADVLDVSRDTARFSSEVGGTQIFSGLDKTRMDIRGVIMLEMDPPKHTRYRQLVNKGFTPRMVQALEHALRHRATLIVDQVIEQGAADLVEDLAAELPLQAIAEIMGVPQEDRRKLFDWTNRMVGAADPEFDTGPDGPAQASAELFAYVNQLAAERRVHPRDDIATTLLQAEVDGEKLTETEFDMFMLLLAVAGNETTRNTTTVAMHSLLTHPEQLELLTSDLDAHLGTAIEEALRWASPVLHFRRTATVDVELRDKLIRAGDRVVLWYPSANRDEEVWDDPFTFDITRNPNPHVAFGGGGVHFCLGASLARAELRCILTELLTRMPDMRPAGEPEYLYSNFIGGIKHLPVTWTPSSRVLARSS